MQKNLLKKQLQNIDCNNRQIVKLLNKGPSMIYNRKRRQFKGTGLNTKNNSNSEIDRHKIQRNNTRGSMITLRKQKGNTNIVQ